MSEKTAEKGRICNGKHIGFEVMNRQWIETDDRLTYHGWPTIANMGNDRLALVCSGGREAHVDPFGRVYLYVSPDGGKSWSKPRKLSSGPLDDRDAGIIVTPAGTWLVNYFTSLAFAAHGDRNGAQAHWTRAEDSITVSGIRREHGFFMLRSTDGGKTWSDKYRIPVNNVHGPIILRDGSLFYCGRAYSSNCMQQAAFAEEMVCLRSDDDGLTWQEISRFKTGDIGDQEVRGWHEIHTVETDSGKLITHIRYRSSTWQITSTDGGKSWQGLHQVTEGYPPHLLKLRDGRLLLSYGCRQKPFGSRCRISSDEGESWSEPLLISDDGATVDLGYTSTAELSDGSLVTAWYEFRPDKGVALLRCASWRLDA